MRFLNTDVLADALGQAVQPLQLGPQARLSMLLSYGFVNNKAVEYITLEGLAVLPTGPEIRERLYVYNAGWWTDNKGTVLARWASRLLH